LVILANLLSTVAIAREFNFLEIRAVKL